MEDNIKSEHQGIFECPICLLPLILPITISCGHTYCQPCIKSKNFKYVKNLCPLCRRKISLRINEYSINIILDRILMQKYGHLKNYQERLQAVRKLNYPQVVRWLDDVKKWIKQKLPWIIIVYLLYHLLKVKISAFNFSLKGYRQKALEIADSIKGQQSLDFKFLLFSQFMRVVFSNIAIP